MAIVHIVGNKVYLRQRSGSSSVVESQDTIMDEEGFLWRQVGEGTTNEATQAIARLMSVEDDISVYITEETT